jgi:type VI secretion system secreted protein Hcp
MHDISFTKGIDKATPKLILACATGQHIPKAAMAMRKAGGDQKEYLKITLEDVMVSSYSTSGAGGGESPTESISLAFGKITFEYFEQDNKGTTTSSGKAGWDVKQNKQV